MKIAAGVEYCGARFFGWQRQKSLISVQQHVEEALSVVADHRVRVHCAGRTDTGVHAVQQVIHFETKAHREMYSWVFGANANMCPDVSLVWAKQMDDDFHARFSATGRSYRYIILNRPSRPGLGHGLVTWEYRALHEELMSTAAADLIGEHDFTAFRAQGCRANTPVREIRRLNVYRNSEYVIIEIEANAFLQHMVRNIAGVLMAIGMGKKGPYWARQVLQARDRSLGGVTAPAQGLYLADIEYPDKFIIPRPDPARWPLFLHDPLNPAALRTTSSKRMREEAGSL
ncbi:MAG: tRNA pseudouridine(38-40) synthase TruA [Gammaproteobacteria bacterium]